MNWTTIVLAALLASSAVADAQTPAPAPDPAPPAAAKPNILDRAVNLPGVAWTFYGADQTAKPVPATGIPGDQAVRVTVKRKGANPWDVGGMYPTNKPIAANDTILIAVYLRAPDTKPGETTTIPFLGATGAEAPYPSLASASVKINAEWKIYYAAGVAPQKFAPGQARASIHLASEKQVIELGPAFILDFGPGYDVAKLPKN